MKLTKSLLNTKLLQLSSVFFAEILQNRHCILERKATVDSSKNCFAKLLNQTEVTVSALGSLSVQRIITDHRHLLPARKQGSRKLQTVLSLTISSL